METTDERVTAFTVDECRAREIEPWVGCRAFVYGGDQLNCLESGTIPSVRIGDRCRRYSIAALDAFIEKQLAASTK
jgi:hypothetical protein